MPLQSLRGRCAHLILLIIAVLTPATFAQTQRHIHHDEAFIILPQRRIIAPRHPDPVRIESVQADVTIRNQLATTTLTVTLFNPANRVQEGQLLMPLPDGATISRLGLGADDAELQGRVLPRDEAKRIYQDIVNRMKDPALLEFAGLNLVRSSVFPIGAKQKQQFRVTYENLLTADNGRFDYHLPRSHALDYQVPWTVRVDIRSPRAIATTYCPTHTVDITRHSQNHVTLNLSPESAKSPGPFRVAYLIEQQKADGLSTTILATPDTDGLGGYFLLLGGMPTLKADQLNPVKREVTLVIDRSGSMGGEKFKQAIAAARQIIAGLEPGEAFNIISYSDSIEAFSDSPIAKDDESAKRAFSYLESLRARGGTNIHDALHEALRPAPAKGNLPIVLFLTDGLPTVGETSESVIREIPVKANPHNKRVFSFGVGSDVNTPLLERLSDVSRGKATFILPGEDVEVAVGSVFRRLDGPILTDITLNPRGRDAHNAVADILPNPISDLFNGDQLVLLGRYTNAASPLTVKLSGNFLGDPQTFAVDLDPKQASLANAFVARLWATRKIAFLIDNIRQSGADPSHQHVKNNPKTKELVDEIVRLSLKFGIMTEYTAFLADENQQVSAATAPRMMEVAAETIDRDAVSKRTGMAAVSQSTNSVARKSVKTLDARNSYFGVDMEEKQINTVQQLGDRTYFRKAGRWVDANAMMNAKDDPTKDAKRIVMGSDEYWQLADRLIKQGRSSLLAMSGELLIEDAGERYLIVPGTDATRN